MLLSAGGFTVYRGSLPIYKTLIPRFGSLKQPENRKRVMDVWLRSIGFRRSGLDAVQLTVKVMEECRNGGDFIRIIMSEIARSQNAHRWAVYDPDNALMIDRIKAEIPDALFLHIIRDGRDIALSLKKMGGFQPLPWDRNSRSLVATAMYWEWIVRSAQKHGRRISSDYVEVHYEDLVSDPQLALKKLGEFLDHDLNYDRIKSAGLGRLSESNSSFRDETERGRSAPMNRWRTRLSRGEVADIERLVGKCLEELGYALCSHESERKPGFREKWMRTVYQTYLDTKLWLKINTPLGKMASLSELEIGDQAP
jgi:Sulfotransferase family